MNIPVSKTIRDNRKTIIYAKINTMTYSEF